MLTEASGFCCKQIASRVHQPGVVVLSRLLLQRTVR
jgi:hypothetical protein